MALTPQIQSSQLFVTAVANFPTAEAQVSQFYVGAVTGGATPQVEVSQFFVTAVVRGRVDDYRVRAWTFSLDGHDFYVLQLGESGTAVLDLATGQWAMWDSFGRDTWRAVLGRNWTGIGPATLRDNENNSNIIAGDDAYGVLWLLDPALGYDEDPVDESETIFERVATGGLPMRMRQTARCNEVYLLAVKGQESLTVAAPVVTLETSDDAEQTWIDQGSVAVVSGEYDAEFAWRSLGLIREPGRIFRVTDNCLARVDGLDMR